MADSQPQTESSGGRNRIPALALFIGAALLVATLDLWSKSWAFGLVRDSEEGRVVIWQDRFEFIRAYNDAGMWSVGYGAEHSNTILKVVGCLVVCLVLGWGIWTVRRNHRATACLAGFILGGAIGNLYDRFVFPGVRDFIQVYLWGGYRYPTFNVADSFLVCSVATLILGQWWAGGSESKRETALAT